MNKYSEFLKTREKLLKQKSLILRKIYLKRIEESVKRFESEFEEIKKVVLFGSIVDGEFNECSDIDIYIENITGEEYYKIKRLLEDELSKEIDIYTQTDNERFVNKIMQKGIVIYERKSGDIDCKPER